MVEFFDKWSPWQARELGRRGLTVQQETFCKAVMSDPGSERVVQGEIAAPSSNNPAVRASQLSSSPAVKKRLDELATDLGVTPTLGILKVKDQLEATKTVVTGKGQSIEVPDNQAQLRAAEMVLAVHGLKATGPSGAGNTTINVLAGDNWREVVREFADQKRRGLEDGK